MPNKKIYNEIILLWNEETNSYDTLYEDSYSYDGPVDMAMAKKDDLDIDISGDGEKVINVIDRIAKSTRTTKNATSQYSKVVKNQITVLKGLAKVYQTLETDQKKLTSEQKAAIEKAHQLAEITDRIKSLKAQEAALERDRIATTKLLIKQEKENVKIRQKVAGTNLKDHFKKETQALKEQARQEKLANAAKQRASKVRRNAAEQLRNINFKLKAHGLSLKDITKGTDLAKRAMRGEAKALGDIKRNMQQAIKTGELYGKQLDMLEVRNHRNAMSLSRVRSVMLMAAFATGTAQRAFTFLTEAYIKQEKVEKMVSAAVKSTGMAAGWTSTQLYGYAAQLQELTGVGDEVVLSSTSLLLTFKRLGGEEFKRAQESAIDLTLALNQGQISEEKLKATTIMLGKAMDDPLAGMASLQKAGVKLSEQQKQQVRTFMELGDTAAAQNIILKEVESQVGGLGRAFKNTTQGQIMAMQGAFGDLKEEIAVLFMPALKALIKGMTGFFKIMQSKHVWVFITAITIASTRVWMLDKGIKLSAKSMWTYVGATKAGAWATKGLTLALKGLGKALAIGIALEAVILLWDGFTKMIGLSSSETEDFDEAMGKAGKNLNGMTDAQMKHAEQIEENVFQLDKELRALQARGELNKWMINQEYRKEGIIKVVTSAEIELKKAIIQTTNAQKAQKEAEKTRLQHQKDYAKALQAIKLKELDLLEVRIRNSEFDDTGMLDILKRRVSLDEDIEKRLNSQTESTSNLIAEQKARITLENQLLELGWSYKLVGDEIILVDEEKRDATGRLAMARYRAYKTTVALLGAESAYAKQQDFKKKQEEFKKLEGSIIDVNKQLKTQLDRMQLASGREVTSVGLRKTGSPASELELAQFDLKAAYLNKEIELTKQLQEARESGNSWAIDTAEKNIQLNKDLFELSSNWMTELDGITAKEQEFAEAMDTIWSTMGDLFSSFSDRRLEESKRVYDEEMAMVKRTEDYKLAVKHGHQKTVDRLEKAARDKYADAIKREHRLEQMAAIASVTFDFAKAIGKGYAKRGPLAAITDHPMLAAAMAVQIGAIMAQPVPQFGLGGDFITSGPQPIMVGDNPGGRERVSITPLSSPNVNGPQSSTIVNVNVSGNMMSEDYTEDILIPQINDAVRRGTILRASYAEVSKL